MPCPGAPEAELRYFGTCGMSGIASRPILTGILTGNQLYSLFMPKPIQFTLPLTGMCQLAANGTIPCPPRLTWVRGNRRMLPVERPCTQRCLHSRQHTSVTWHRHFGHCLQFPTLHDAHPSFSHFATLFPLTSPLPFSTSFLMTPGTDT